MPRDASDEFEALILASNAEMRAALAAGDSARLDALTEKILDGRAPVPDAAASVDRDDHRARVAKAIERYGKRQAEKTTKWMSGGQLSPRAGALGPHGFPVTSRRSP